MNGNAPLNSPVRCGVVCKADSVQLHQHASLKSQVTDFFTHIFDTSDWPPRWHCGTWTDFHGWLYIISDLTIWASYFLIPILLVRMITKRKDLPFPRVIWLFGAFIILCGITHFLDALIFWWPAYRLSALVRLATGIVSTITVYALYRILPLVMSLRTVQDLEKEIAERKSVEEKLAASEFMLSEAGRVSRVGGWEVDLVTGNDTWTSTVYDIFELDQNMPPKEVNVIQYFPQPYRQQLLEAINKATSGGGRWDLELLYVSPNNREVWIRSIGEAEFDESGTACKLKGVLIDIHKYKINELALSETVGLMAQQNQQLKNFTHILSHNIRNHASNISLLCSFVEENTLDENNADIFGKMKKVSGALNNTLEDLSAALKVREGGVDAETQHFDQITREVLNVMDIDLKTNQAIVETQFEVTTVKFPGIYLESIIMNLISNSIKYRKADVTPHIIIKTYLDTNKRCVLQYTDNGVGIDLALHGEKLFGLYKTFHKHKDAHGVGLFMMKNQVESQGGKIAVESTVNEGTTFKITFNE